MGNKNHSTVILATRKIDLLMSNDQMVMRQTPAGLQSEKLRDIVDKIEEQLGTTKSSPVIPLIEPRSPMLAPRVAAV